MPNAAAPNAVEMIGVTKRFGSVVANDDVSFAVRAGEVHALLGENGAGKSTLMSVLAGLYQADAGTLLLHAKPVRLQSPRDALAQGVGMVYQHFMLIDSFTVAENAMLGLRKQRLDTAVVERELAAVSERFGMHVNPKARIWQLSVGEQQRVEIVRLLYRGAKILIFDEPTAVLTPQEAEKLIATLRDMAAQGFSIIFISHKLDEVLAVADRITVLRRGRTVTTIDRKDADRPTLARLMVGRPMLESLRREPTELGPEVLAINDLRAHGENGFPALDGVSLTVRAGEILGIAGVAGNGQRELAETITGLRPITGGEVRVNDQVINNRSPQSIIAMGVAHIPEDRAGTGLIPTLNLSDNLILKEYRRKPLARGALLDSRAIKDFAERLLREYQVASPGPEAKARLLSGGNQQKLLVARELSGEPRLIVAVHPTRGVDIGATEAIHQLLLDERKRGVAVLLISEDLDELLVLADRVAVLFAGKVMGTVACADADLEHIGLMMAGTPAQVARGSEDTIAV